MYSSLDLQNQKEAKKKEEQQELKELNQALSGKLENQNQTHNVRREGTSKINKTF